MSANQDEKLSREVLELTSYGLTTTQARVYLFLLSVQAAPARQIAKEVDLHRVDVYRKLRELAELGLVEIHLDSPMKYAAINPDMAISSLLVRMESRLDTLEQSSKQLRKTLTNYSQESKMRAAGGPSVNYFGDRVFKIIRGRKKYYADLHKLVGEAKSEILRIVSAYGLNRTSLPTGLYKEYLKAKRRGVSLRMISEITPDNIGNARKLSKVLQLRHLDNIHLRYIVVDRSLTIVSARFDESNISPTQATEDDHLFFADPAFAEATCFFFEHLWKTAKPLESIADKIFHS